MNIRPLGVISRHPIETFRGLGLNAFRLFCAFLAATAMPPALAQDSATQPANQAETVGPRELENFSLEGRVTRPAEEAVRPAPEPVPAAPPQARSEPPAERAVARPNAPSAAERRPIERSATRELLVRPPTRPQPRTAEAAPPASPPRPSLVSDVPVTESSSLLMWVAALLFAGGAGAVYWYLRHGRARPAMAGGYRAGYARQPAAAPQPAPSPAPLPRAAAPSQEPLAQRPLPTTLRPKPDALVSSAPPAAAPPAKPVGIVATSLRPWIDVELTPDRALVDDNGAAIAFNVTLVNSGSAPARDVSIEACLLNAGTRQDAELSEFYLKPKKSSDSIPVIAPMARVPLRTAVKIPREMIHEYEVEGRKLFMPMVAVSTCYRWSSGEGQTGASFLVGKGQEAEERLAPLRVDQGNRSWQRLGARRYEKGLRR